MVKIFFQGGLLMYPLAICLTITFVITIERISFWKRLSHSKDKETLQNITKSLRENKYEAFLNNCKKSDYIINKILLKLSYSSKENFKQNVDIEITKEYENLKKGHLVLDTIIAISPMIGILGTVVGIILSFQAMAMTGMDNPKAVTGGIGQALITTATGLIIAIVALLISNIFNSKVNQLTDEFDIYISQLEIYKNNNNSIPKIKVKLKEEFKKANIQVVKDEDKKVK